MTFTCETCVWSLGGVQLEKLGGPKSAIFPTLFMIWGPFLERPGNSMSPKSYFEIKISRKVGCVLTSNEVHFVSLVKKWLLKQNTHIKARVQNPYPNILFVTKVAKIN